MIDLSTQGRDIMRIEKIELPHAGYGPKTATLTAYVQDNMEDQSALRRAAGEMNYSLCKSRWRKGPLSLVPTCLASARLGLTMRRPSSTSTPIMATHQPMSIGLSGGWTSTWTLSTAN